MMHRWLSWFATRGDTQWNSFSAFDSRTDRTRAEYVRSGVFMRAIGCIVVYKE